MLEGDRVLTVMTTKTEMMSLRLVATGQTFTIPLIECCEAAATLYFSAAPLAGSICDKNESSQDLPECPACEPLCTNKYE
jgi:hypothetical protein